MCVKGKGKGKGKGRGIISRSRCIDYHMEDLFLGSDVWEVPYAPRDTPDAYTPKLITDGFTVSLSGRVEWAAGGVMGSQEQGKIGKINAEDYVPKYDSIFTVTNDMGLMGSIEILGSETLQSDTRKPGDIFLTAWSVPVLFYETNGGVYRYVTNEKESLGQLDLATPDNLQLRKQGDSTPSYEPLNDFYTINFDGISYTASTAFDLAISTASDNNEIQDEIPNYFPEKIPNAITIDFVTSLSGIIFIFTSCAIIGIFCGITTKSVSYFCAAKFHVKTVNYNDTETE